MTTYRTLTRGAVLGILTTGALALSVPVQADSTGAFLGGMIASRVLGDMRRNTQAQEVQAHAAQQQAAAAQQPVPQIAPAPAPAPAAMTPEQKIQQLDKLAAGGYITPEEYKAKKQAILNNL